MTERDILTSETKSSRWMTVRCAPLGGGAEGGSADSLGAMGVFELGGGAHVGVGVGSAANTSLSAQRCFGDGVEGPSPSESTRRFLPLKRWEGVVGVLGPDVAL